jgi:hypothetical protein
MSFLRRGGSKTKNSLVYLGEDFTVAILDNTTPYSANAALRFNTNGTFQRIETNSGGIVTQPITIFSISKPNALANTDFYVRADYISATNSIVPSGSATDTWLQTNAPRTWYAIETSADLSSQSILDIKITTNPNGSPIDRIRVELRATTGGVV